MTHFPSDEHLELQRVQRELEANRRKISELEQLINDVPAIYERKFDQKLQPLVEDVRLLSERNHALREQLRQALSPAAQAAPGTETPNPAAPETATPVPPPAQPRGRAEATAAAPSGGGETVQPRGPARAAEPVAPEAPVVPAAPVTAPDSAPAVVAHAAPGAAAPLAPRRRPRSWSWSWRPRLAWPKLPARPSLALPRLQPKRSVALALAAGLGLAGGLALQQLRSQAPRSGSPGRTLPTPAPGQPRRTLTLELHSAGETWLDVRDQRGRSLYAGLFSGTRRFPIGQGLRLNAGKPELVSVRIGDGPERPLGPQGWWVWHRFDADGRLESSP